MSFMLPVPEASNDQCDHIACTQRDGDGGHFEHALAVAGEKHRRQAGEQRQHPAPVVAGGEEGEAVVVLDVVDGGGRQVQSDDGNAHAPHHRREQPVDKPHADELDEQSEHQVDGTRTHHAPHGTFGKLPVVRTFPTLLQGSQLPYLQPAR